MITKDAQKNKEVITKEMIDGLKKMFGNEQEYLKIMRNLWATRKGLYTIMKQRQDLKESIAPQFQALNELIDTLLNSDLEHPIYG